MQKALPEPAIRDLRKDLDVENPFFYHSIGLGKEWIDEKKGFQRLNLYVNRE